MDLFQILILLFILYPLLQKLFGGGKKPGRNRRADQSTTSTGERQPYSRESSRSDGSESWDDALRELESIFTGETTRRPASPEPVVQPVPTPSTRQEMATRNQRVSNSNPSQSKSPQLKRQLELQERYEKTKKSGSILDEIEEEDNPIYQSIDEGAIVEDEERDYSEDTRKYLGLDDTRELQRHLILKEILDKPLSKRNQGHRLPH